MEQKWIYIIIAIVIAIIIVAAYFLYRNINTEKEKTSLMQQEVDTLKNTVSKLREKTKSLKRKMRSGNVGGAPKKNCDSTGCKVEVDDLGE